MLFLYRLFLAVILESPGRRTSHRASEQNDSSGRHRRPSCPRAIAPAAVALASLTLLLSGCGASLSVNGPNALVVNPGSIAFGTLPIGSSAKADVTLVNETRKAVVISGVTISGNYFSLLNDIHAPVLIPVRGSYHLTVAFTPTGAGAAGGDLIVSAPATPSGRAVVHLSGQATKPTTVTPSSATLSINATSASFGDVAVNTTATQSFTLMSTGSAAVNISASTVTGTAFTTSGLIAPTTLPPGQSITVNVQFHPTARGAATGALVIDSNSASNGALSLPLSGNGVAHIVQLNWQAADANTPIAGYRIYRSLNGVSHFKMLNSSLSSRTQFVDGSIQPGQTYDYYVTSVDTSGAESAPSNTATVAVPAV